MSGAAGDLYRSGDVVFADDEGYLTFVGRSDDVFKSSDYRISPFELESILLEHESVAEAAVVPSPDPIRLAIPKAYVLLVSGAERSPDTALSIFKHLHTRLAPFKRIRRIELVTELPKTISGKIRRVQFVLATTVLQTCIRYESRKKTCQFCAIGQSLAAGRTIAHKTPEQLAEVARAAVLLDGVKHMVMTTGTPNATDRGAKILCDSAFAIKAAVDLPLQAQCEPPDDDRWFQRLHAAGVDTLGMHLEVVTPALRERVMPGKASVPVERYLEAFEAAVAVFGRGQVSTYILAGLGDSREAILTVSERLLALGVYPFVVPFVPISGTPLEDHPPPAAEFMKSLLEPLGAMVAAAGLRSIDIKAGCGKCGACSSLSVYEAGQSAPALAGAAP